MLFHVCSVPFTVQARCSLFPERLLLFSKISAKYCGVYQLQKNNLKILEYFEFATTSDKLLLQQKYSGVAGGFKIMYPPPISEEPRDAFGIMSSI